MASTDVAILAVKDLAYAKSRLAGMLSPAQRGDLAMAMFMDVLTALRHTPAVDVLVISPDAAVRAIAGEFGAITIAESTHAVQNAATGHDYRAIDQDGHALNRAFGHAVAYARREWPGSRTTLLQADLPALRHNTLTEVIGCAYPHRRAFLADHRGSGTVLVSLAADAVPELAFGANSATAHRSMGMVDLAAEAACQRWEDMRTDVDTPEDLAKVAALGLGQHTARMLTAFGVNSRYPPHIQRRAASGNRNQL